MAPFTDAPRRWTRPSTVPPSALMALKRDHFRSLLAAAAPAAPPAPPAPLVVTVRPLPQCLAIGQSPSFEYGDTTLEPHMRCGRDGPREIPEAPHVPGGVVHSTPPMQVDMPYVRDPYSFDGIAWLSPASSPKPWSLMEAPRAPHTP
eukprot:GGOE01049656.1.p1 GENE.GGOE01049656.1~~GGOE01049656.1.p1  ORF type:complete len:155 (-),score=11.50 GGOE01049656.1:11-451(-)